MKKFKTRRITDIFERAHGEIIMGDGFSKLKVSNDISDTLPLLSYLGITYRKNEVIADCINWFEKGIKFLNYGSPIQELQLAIANSANNKELILDMIKEMDLDIDDFRVERKDNDSIHVFTSHNIDGKSYEIDLTEESSGTRKIFGLLPFIAESITNGVTLVIDELDAKIHPILLKHIIMLYNSSEINKHGAQLIFTSHDLSTMNSDVFRRDEIWFVAKGHEQNSKLYSLVEFNRNSRHLILTTRVLVLCTVLLYSTHSLQFVFTRSVLYCGWTLHFKLRIYFVHLFYRLRGQQVFRKYLNNLILEY
jgi:AAA15 family ATPase/GTPase